MSTSSVGARRLSRRHTTSSASPFLARLLGGPVTLGGLLEAIRLGEDETQVVFARRLGISTSHLCDIERGRKGVAPARAARFATALGYSTDQFVRLALQDAVDRAGLALTVQVRAG